MKKNNKTITNQTLPVTNIAILFLGVAIGIIHILQPDTLLTLNGVGYIVLTAGSIFTIKGAEAFKEVAPKVLIVYTLTTISMFFVLMGESAIGHTLGLTTKILELLLVLILFVGQRNKKKEGKSWVSASNHHLTRKGESW